ncbi:MAG: cysteine-rich small domain-containing protein [Syntrophomonadaceae bacterium]|nr:cysteine-rich small domain-containing protein [Syntrophomonadaceae bacterium]
MSEEKITENHWQGKKYSFFSHTECEFFPCHKFADTAQFNCLFCFCPLYILGKECGGKFIYQNGVKDCSQCILPHMKKNYVFICGKFSEIVEKMKTLSAGDS